MKVLYAHEEVHSFPNESLFLAGPSPRGAGDYDWRPEALEILERLGYQGTVFVPLPRDGQWLDEYENQIEWELKHLHMATSIAFWVPRDLVHLPGFTTNVEYGLFLKSGKIVLGYPSSAVKMRYLDYLARKFLVPVRSSLEDTLRDTIALRYGHH